MRYLIWVAAISAVMVGRPASAGDVVFKPIDTKKLVVQPSKTAADLTAATIKMAGSAAAGNLEGNGYVKTINNLFGFRKSIPTPTQNGRSPIPSPGVFTSTKYPSYNSPVMPIAAPSRR